MKGKGFLWVIIVAILVLAGCGQNQDSARDEMGFDNDEDFGVISSEQSTVNTKIKSKPALVTSSTSATFKFVCTSAPCEFKCKLDSNAWKKCKSPKTYTGLSEGAHTFKVKAGKNGVWDKSPAEYSWTILAKAIDVSADIYHTCAITGPGGVKCWGNNDGGQLGTGNTTDSNVPVNVSSLSSGVSAISGGVFHTCVLTSSGGVKCWGDNSASQLGTGDNNSSLIPVDVSGLTSGVSAISSGYYHNCVLKSGGVKCWGWNFYGQLGNGSNTDSNVPVDVSDLTSGISAISAGYYHSCAVTTGGAVKCWGKNDNGQLGNGNNNNSNVPVNVSGLDSISISEISAGNAHTCALTSGGGVKCWGFNRYGQLGNGTTQDSYTPVDVSNLSSDVQAISTGGYHTCALTTSGGVKCWGENMFGKLGNGNNVNSSIPVDVSGLLSGIGAISAGDNHTCAVTTTGGVKCWGRNSEGQLGNGNYNSSNVPVNVVGFIP